MIFYRKPSRQAFEHWRRECLDQDASGLSNQCESEELNRLAGRKGRMRERIAVSRDIHLGKPCVVGTRIPVQSVLELVREGIPFSQIIEDYYSELEPEDICACIQYAIDVVAVEDIRLAPTP